MASTGWRKEAPLRTQMLELASELREFEMPKPLFTTRERTELVPACIAIVIQPCRWRTDLSKVIKGPGTPRN